MPTTGAKFPTSATTADRSGNQDWVAPGNATADDGIDASGLLPTDYLVCSAFDFAGIPDSAIIVGVTVLVEASETGAGGTTYIPQLHSDTTPTFIGAAKAPVTLNGATKVVTTNGSSSDLWGATLTPSVVKAAGFGVSIWSTDLTNTLLIDYVTMQIHYRMVADRVGAGIIPWARV